MSKQTNPKMPNIDILFVDDQLSDMTATEVMETINSSEAVNVSTFVALIDLTKVGEGKNLEDTGFSQSISKPVNYTDLINCLEPVAINRKVEPVSSPQQTDKDKPVLSSKNKILLVEDNKINQMIATGILEHLGVKPQLAENGIEALQMLEKSEMSPPFDIILMDCQMPEMDGYECTRSIRALPDTVSYRDIPIIAMTANAMQGDREKCIEAGMSDYVTKPINEETLRGVLQKWLT